ncbi:hypothetical protein NSK_006798 [Nannochloropsis salina CCMP1776]|uniref:L-type lectin-like domain-containing protein n=1 Tax=Nannochloropsis salina CCMP1776 TaxID=1027361 RepID=A0A4D9CRV8_9STRA|nr:hypothetical protein NSK_006798 [Nannochloropsis salina CCMP1776]|eukprot:TFJ81546.1 hypothetical protein NSK_006798 [Nannochloropsis salina CCMP1776]
MPLRLSSPCLGANRDWSPAGETQVNQNFVRLTPDRQSKIGALWSHKALGVDAVTMTLKFRIHGQGKKFFGDGIGFWIMESPYWQEGDVHGVSHAFVGVGVAFDTFRNTEHGTRHRDVAVFVNNGDRSREEVLTGFDGCDASIRYHGERADFSVTNSSRAKLTIEHWLRKAHVGLTGTTGQLADNHDVISLHTFNDLDVHPEADDLIVTPKFGHDVADPPPPGRDAGAQRASAGRHPGKKGRAQEAEGEEGLLHAISVLQLVHPSRTSCFIECLLPRVFDPPSFGYSLPPMLLQDHIANTIRKLQSQEDVSEARIVALEQELFKSVEGTVEERLKSVEGSISNAMAHRVAAIETNLHSKVNTVMAAAGSGGGGRWPMIFMCLLLALCMFQMYRWVERLKKSHIL